MIIRMIVVCIALLIPSRCWATTYTSITCAAADVNNVISSASQGDTIIVPAGSCSWASGVSLNESITLMGSDTIITSGTLTVRAAGVAVTGFTFNGGKISVVSNNYRIYNNTFNTSGEAIGITGASYGLIDSNTFNASGSSTELIHVWGPNDSWSTQDSMGASNNVFIENNTFNGVGGASQAAQGNYNARIVFRYNDVTGMKFDMHGIWSNGNPAHYLDWSDPIQHSARHCEVYNNSFTSIYPWAIELRGGTGVIYNNTISTRGDGIVLREYCTSVGTDGNCARCMCPNDYPLRDQIGRGKNQELEPMYLWNNTVNGKAVVQWTGSWGTAPQAIVYEGHPSSACVSACGSQDGYSNGGITMSNLTAIIKGNRDYYIAQKPGYISYSCPHPLVGGGICNSNSSGRTGYPSQLIEPPKKLRITN